MNSLLSIVAESVNDNSYRLLFAALLLPMAYLMAEKRKRSWLQKLLIKKIMKRAAKNGVRKWKTFFGLLGLIGFVILLITGNPLAGVFVALAALGAILLLELFSYD